MAGARAHGIPDWTNAASYAALPGAERAAFAWEWLRRQDAYREAALAPPGRHSPLAWGLATFADPNVAVPDARPIWRAQVNPWVLEASARPGETDPDSFDRALLENLALDVIDQGVEQLLLSDGRHSLRLDLTGARTTDGPVRLTFLLSGLRSLARPLTTLARLRSLVISRRLTPAQLSADQRARRMVQVLRAADGLAAGASQADLAEILLVLPEGRKGWRVSAPSVRSQAQRLVRAVRHMDGGAYRGLLD